MITRRSVLSAGGLGLALLSGASLSALTGRAGAEDANAYPVAMSDAEWRKRLTRNQYAVLRREGTERAFSSPLLHEARSGIFGCAGCEQDLFASNTKYDSHTGWPSFWAPIEGAVGETGDRTFGMERTAVHCSRCGGHLGHVFTDGPQPTGRRYCMNGVAMTFRAGAA